MPLWDFTSVLKAIIFPITLRESTFCSPVSFQPIINLKISILDVAGIKQLDLPLDRPLRLQTFCFYVDGLETFWFISGINKYLWFHIKDGK